MAVKSKKLFNLNDFMNVHTGGARLIQSHSLARFCFELSGNLN